MKLTVFNVPDHAEGAVHPQDPVYLFQGVLGREPVEGLEGNRALSKGTYLTSDRWPRI